ncbi:Transcription factor TFIIIC, putative isoform 1 [Theobroma cacao]|uniref:Transcription factor TFIIIC, putative isoform 1 n=1 Tax=Theobroma cacao TaxID=3641 RepID=A0A061F685_THECC|nr:Transcription factor TFIIIC, putative isoform 1 [Theobroma cacao]
MEENKKADGLEEEGGESEYVLLDLDAVSGQIDIPPNAPYTLSGLDTTNPILLIDQKVKLIGEYEETIGTCLVFSEDEASPVVHEETGPSEANLFSGKYIIDPNQAPRKQVKPVAQLHKILKFRLLLDDDAQDETNSPTNSNL